MWTCSGLLWFHSDVTVGSTETKWDIRKQLSINIVCLFSIRMKKKAVFLCYIIYFLKHKKDLLFSVIHLSLTTQKSQVNNLYQQWFIHMHFALPFPPYLFLVVSVHLHRVSAILASPIVFDVHSNSPCECVLASMMEMESIISHSYSRHEEKILVLKHKVKHTTTYP